MIDYAEHLTQMDKIRKQLREALLKNQYGIAYGLCLMLEKETQLLTQNIAEKSREQESRSNSGT